MINNVEDNNSNIGNDYNNDINKNKEPCGVEFTTNRGEEIWKADMEKLEKLVSV